MSLEEVMRSQEMKNNKKKDIEDYEKKHRLERSSHRQYQKMLTKITEKEKDVNKSFEDEIDDDEIALREDADDVDSFDSDEDEEENEEKEKEENQGSSSS